MSKKSKIFLFFILQCILVTFITSYYPEKFLSLSAKSTAINVPNTSETLQSVVFPEIISSKEIKENKYISRLKSLETDLNTLVFQNADGTNTIRSFSHPVKYINDNGDIRDITLDLAKDLDGNYKTVENSIKTTFPNRLSNGITLENKDLKISMTPSKK